MFKVNKSTILGRTSLVRSFFLYHSVIKAEYLNKLQYRFVQRNGNKE